LPISRAERDFHRKTAAKCFNRAWDHLEMKARTREQSREMLHLAHASRYHWGLVGTPRNRAVGEWQLSRVYAELGEPRLALLFAKSCMQVCRSQHLTELLPTANEAVARAYAVAGDSKNARRYLAKARRQLDLLVLDKEERGIYSRQITETEALIQGRSVRGDGASA